VHMGWLVLLFLLPVVSWAHGGVSVEDDVCIMKIGRFKTHFTGYLPQQRATQEFCEDIPTIGDSIIVIDFISDELRDMDVNFRIIRDVNDIGLQATYEDLGNQGEIEQASLHYLEPTQYPQGIMTVRYTFEEVGNYIGIVEVWNPILNKSYRAVFPFQVGKTDYTQYALYYIVLFVGCGLFVYLAGRRRFFGDH